MPVEGATRAPIIAAGIGDHWFNSGGEWTVRVEGSRIVFPALEKRSCEVGMQSEPGWPRIILDVYPRPPGEEGAPDRDSFMRTVRTCMSTRSLFFLPRYVEQASSTPDTPLLRTHPLRWPRHRLPGRSFPLQARRQHGQASGPCARSALRGQW